MKKVFILILCCFILFSCTTKTNMTIKPATLTNEEQNILKLFDIDDSTLIFVFSFVSMIAAPPVAVNVALFGFGAPYSVGFLNCFSLLIL